MNEQLLEVVEKIDVDQLKKQLDLLILCVDGVDLTNKQRFLLSGLENFISELVRACEEGS